MASEGIGHAERGGELRAEQAGAQDPHLDLRAAAGHGDDAKVRLAGEMRAQFDDVAGNSSASRL